MNIEKRKAATPPPHDPEVPPASAVPVPPLFRRLDWITFGITTLLVFIGYFFTVAPDLTLEDSGELAVGSFYAGVPHPPGYPVWTIYTWLFTLLPFANIAFRVALSSAVAGALSCGLLALLVSRGSSMLLEGISELKNIEGRFENWICLVSGFVSGMLLGFNGFMWSQSIIVEVYTFSVLSFMGVLCFLLRWIYAPHQRRFLYWAFFLFGICFTNHQTLIVAAMGLEVAVLAAQPKLGRDMLMGNSVIYLAGLGLKIAGLFTAFDQNKPLFIIYNVVGISSLAGWVWVTALTRQRVADWIVLGRDLLLVLGWVYLLVLFAAQGQIFFMRPSVIPWLHFAGLGSIAGCGFLIYRSRRLRWDGLPLALQILLGYSALYLLVQFFGSWRESQWLNSSVPVFIIHNLLGLGAIFGACWMLARLTDLASEIKVLLIGAGTWMLGASLYVYMPIASMTNPPMNWGYPRTVEGFWHALTRGQYEKTNPTESVSKLVQQIDMFYEGARDEFSLVYLLVGLVPFFFLRRMQKRERAWLIGLTAIFVCLSVLLMILLNPNTDRQSREQSRVFFTASHIVIALAIGYGVTLISGLVHNYYQRYRTWFLGGGAIAAAIQLYSFMETFSETKFALLRISAVLALLLAVGFLAAVLFFKERLPLAVLLVIFGLAPGRSILSNWAQNEQWGHIFGYWFGHDMFTPPFGVYPEMTRDAILFGGTDPGRFNPTYMIFCESFLPPEKKRDPEFDRRDVYIITQNALADGTYLSYIRAHYNRSTQIDPYFFSEFLRTTKEREQKRTNLVAQALLPLDRFFTDFGARIEAKRRARGVYPPEEISTPSPEDSQRAFQDYIDDAQRRLQLNQLKPGEDVRIIENRVQVSGQVAVMAINGLLTKVIFDENPTNEFFVEESFPLDWMFPYLTPYGIIMKINRQPLTELNDQVVSKDHEFWTQYSQRLIGNWINYETPVKEICEFAVRTYLSRDFDGFKGDPKFVRDQFAQKAFSKLRSAIGGLYVWRLGSAKSGADQQRMILEAEFALKQSFAFCPYSPEAVYKYVSLLATLSRFDEAQMIIETSLLFDPDNGALLSLAAQIGDIRDRQAKGQPVNPASMGGDVSVAATQFASNDPQMALRSVSLLLQQQHTNEAVRLLDHIVSSSNATVSTLLSAAQLLAQLGDAPRLVQSIQRLRVQIAPLQEQVRQQPTNAPLAFQLVSAYLLTQQTNEAMALLDQLVDSPQADPSTLFSASQAYGQLQNGPKLEHSLLRLVGILPSNPEAWYNLATIQVALGKTNEALASLEKTVQLSNERLAKQTNAQDLRALAGGDSRFSPLRGAPAFQKLLEEPKR